LIALFLIGIRIYEFILFQSYLTRSYSPDFTFEDVAYSPNPDLTELIFIAINFVILIVLLIAVGSLSAYQLYLALYNMTTIESYEWDRLNNMHIEAEFPWNIGAYKNYQSLFGKLWLFWWIPKSALTDGINWEKNKTSEFEWPPKEYYLIKKGHMSSDGELLIKEITPEEREAMIYDSDVSYASSDDEPLELLQNKFKSQ
jgi:hypothetical protein